MRTQNFQVKELTTLEEAQAIEETLHQVWGIRKVHVNHLNSQVSISFNENAAKTEDFLQAVKEMGYAVEVNEL